MRKDFNDFKKGLQEIHFQLIADKINEMKLSTQIPITEEGVNKFATAICIMSISLTLELLEAYHDWLSQ